MEWVKERVGAIPTFAGRVHGAARLGELREAKQLLQVAPAAFVLPLGISAGPADAATGLYRQPVTRLIGVLLVVRNLRDATGAAALLELDPLIEAVIAELAGVGPDEDAFGVLTLQRGELIEVAAGLVIYQLTFSIDDQLRIPR